MVRVYHHQLGMGSEKVLLIPVLLVILLIGLILYQYPYCFLISFLCSYKKAYTGFKLKCYCFIIIKTEHMQCRNRVEKDIIILQTEAVAKLRTVPSFPPRLPLVSSSIDAKKKHHRHP